MQALTQLPLVFAAAQYSLLYLLFGGGIGGADLDLCRRKGVG